MDARRVFGSALRVYFWALVVLSVLTVLWLLNRFVLGTNTVGTGWYAVAGFGILLALFLVIIQQLIE